LKTSTLKTSLAHLLAFALAASPALAQCRISLRETAKGNGYKVTNYNPDLNENLHDYGAIFEDAGDPGCRATAAAALDLKMKNQMYYLDANSQVRSGFHDKWLGGGDLYFITATGLQLGGQGMLTAETDRKIQCAISNYNLFFKPDEPCSAQSGNTCMDDYVVAAAGHAWIAAYQAKNLRSAQTALDAAKSYFHSAFSTSASVCLRSTGNACNVCSTPSEANLYTGLRNGTYEALVFNHGFENPNYGVGLFTSLSVALEGIRQAGGDSNFTFTPYEKLIAQGIFLQGQKRVAGNRWNNACYNFGDCVARSCADVYRPDMYPVKAFLFDKFTLSSPYTPQVVSPSLYQFDQFEKNGDPGNTFSPGDYWFADGRQIGRAHV